jgi:chemotaxis response regulator CheB
MAQVPELATSLRVLIIDDSPAIQHALGALQVAQSGIEVVGCASERASGRAG